MPTSHKYPFYIRATVILFGLVLISFALANLRGILIPFSFALFLAVLLNPLMERLLRWRLPRVAAIAVSLIVAILVIGGVWYFLANQIMQFTDQLPLLEKKGSELLARTQQFLTQHWNIPLAKTNQYLAEAKAAIKPLLGQLLGTMAGTMGSVFLLPIYTFLLLYYKNLILNFLYEIFAEQNAEEVSAVLRQVRGAIQSYMFGLLIEAAIVATLNTIALLILGVQYAVLMGVLGALLNVLPFFGGDIGGSVADDGGDDHQGRVQHTDRNCHQLYHHPVHRQSLPDPLYRFGEGADQCAIVRGGRIVGRSRLGPGGNVSIDPFYRSAQNYFRSHSGNAALGSVVGR